MSEIENVKDYFVRSAEAFDSLYSEEKTNPFMRYINKQFRRDIYERFILTLDHIKKYKLNSVLDVGCGSGRYAHAIAQAGVKRIVGIDLSSTMIELAVRHTSSITDAKEIFDFNCGDFMKFHTDEKFDVVIAMGFFDYVNDPVTVLKKMKTLANHSVTVSFPSISVYRTPIRKIRYHFKQCPVYFYKHDHIDELSKEAGFARNETIKIKGAGQDYFTTFFV